MDVELWSLWGPDTASPVTPLVYTAGGWPAVSTPVLRGLVGKQHAAAKALAKETGQDPDALSGALPCPCFIVSLPICVASSASSVRLPRPWQRRRGRTLKRSAVRLPSLASLLHVVHAYPAWPGQPAACGCQGPGQGDGAAP